MPNCSLLWGVSCIPELEIPTAERASEAFVSALGLQNVPADPGVELYRISKIGPDAEIAEGDVLVAHMPNSVVNIQFIEDMLNARDTLESQYDRVSELIGGGYVAELRDRTNELPKKDSHAVTPRKTRMMATPRVPSYVYPPQSYAIRRVIPSPSSPLLTHREITWPTISRSAKNSMRYTVVNAPTSYAVTERSPMNTPGAIYPGRTLYRRM